MRKVIKFNDILEINRLYLQYKTYSGVARALGISASTVKKYIIDGFSLVRVEDIKHFKEKEIPGLNVDIFKENWKSICKLKPEEVLELNDLWKELEL